MPTPAQHCACAAYQEDNDSHDDTLRYRRSAGSMHMNSLCRWTFALAMSLAMAACQAGPLEQAAQAAPTPDDDGSPAKLVINSYNYTDRTISSFYVDGAWGGNVRISKKTSGGGGGTCCVTWIPGTPLPHKYRVRWIADMCIHQVEVEGELFDRHKAFWKEQDVYLTTPPPANPRAFEVHFYKDGHVEVAISDESSTRPRLVLPVGEGGRRPGVPDWPQCNAEQLRTYKD